MDTSSAMVAPEMTQSAYLQDVLGQVIEDVKQLVGPAVVGLLLLDDKSGELLLQRPAIGLAEGNISSARIPLESASISASVLRSGKASISNCVASDLAAVPASTSASGGRNHIAVPVEVDKQRIGVFHMGDKPGGFSKNDLRLAVLFSSHLGILVHNAALLQGERQTVQVLQRTLAIHDELTRTVLDGQGLDVICANLARLVANPVAISDRFGNLASYYPQDPNEFQDENWRRLIARRRAPRTVHDDRVIRTLVAQLDEKRRAARVPGAHFGLDKSIVVAPVIVGRETMAHVSVWEVSRNLDELDFMAVERSATAMALHMMKEKVAAETQYRLLGELVAELIGGAIASEEVLLRRATYLGVDLKLRRTAMIVEVDDLTPVPIAGGPLEKIVALKARLLEIVERACKTFGRNAVVAAKGDEVVVLAAVNVDGGSAAESDMQALADFIRVEVHRQVPDTTVSVGIGGCCQSLDGFSECYREARRALNASRASRRVNRTVAFGKLGAVGILFDPRIVDELAATVRKTLGALAEYDRRHGAQLLLTLEQYLLHHCRVDPTAATMHLHKGTVRYRLKRVEQITGADLDDADSKFNLQLGLKLLRTLETS